MKSKNPGGHGEDRKRQIFAGPDFTDVEWSGEGDDAKRTSEFKPFSLTGDSFKKIIVRQDVGIRWFDDNGVLNINLADFLLDSTVV